MRELGIKGAVCYTTVGEKDLDGEEFWPVYAKAEELGIPIIFHPVNTGPIVGGWRMTRHYATRGYGFWSALGNSMENSITIANLMFGGVLDAFPKLRFCFLEGGGTQVPHLMEGLAAVYSGEGDYDRLSKKPRQEPMDYLDQLYFSVRTTEALLGVLIERYGHKAGWWEPIILTQIPWVAGPTRYRSSMRVRIYRRRLKKRSLARTRSGYSDLPPRGDWSMEQPKQPNCCYVPHATDV